jgi:hypothetical protein
MPRCFNTLKLTGNCKGSKQAYESTRIWLKVKHRDVLDVVCAGVTGPMGRPSTVVVGLPMNGRLWIVGRSAIQCACCGRARSCTPPMSGSRTIWPTRPVPPPSFPERR